MAVTGILHYGKTSDTSGFMDVTATAFASGSLLLSTFIILMGGGSAQTSINLTPQHAREIASALIACADALDAAGGDAP